MQVTLLAAQIQMLAIERETGGHVVELGTVNLDRPNRQGDRSEQCQSKYAGLRDMRPQALHRSD